MSSRLALLAKCSAGLLSFLIASVVGTEARAVDVSATTANLDAVLGSAYDPNQEILLGQSCVTGTREFAGTSVATFSFDQALTEKQASDQLGFSVGGRVRYGVVEASASARFMKNAISNQYSVSAVWLSEYHLPTEKLDGVTLSDIGKLVNSNFEHWKTTCGNEFVTEITRGARLFFSIRVDFSSNEQKQQFESHFSLSGPLFSANADLNAASRQFSRDTKITVSALQIGGDVTKVTGIFPNSSEGRAGFVQCTLGDFNKCAEVVSGALAYATDTDIGFPSQLKMGATPGAAPLLYKTIPYSSAGLFTGEYPFLGEAINLARSRLSEIFERHLRFAVLADRLADIGMDAPHLATIVAERRIIDQNIAAILEVSKTCYTRPEDCVATVSNLNLVDVDETVFELPPLPKASYRLVSAERGIWSRVDSLKWFGDCSKSMFSCDLSTRASGLQEVYSVGLEIEGVALKEARLWFEERMLATIPFSNVSKWPFKVSDNYALLIVDSMRGNPGWRDIDIDQQRIVLAKDLPHADGAFYLEVVDGFGRTVRFDIAYQKWTIDNQSENDGTTRTVEDLWVRQKWWDPNSSGTSLGQAGIWSSDMRFHVEVHVKGANSDISEVLRPPKGYCSYRAPDPTCRLNFEVQK